MTPRHRAHLHATIERPAQLLECLRAATPYTFFVTKGGLTVSASSVRSHLRDFLLPYHSKGALGIRVTRCLERTHYGDYDMRCAISGRQIPWKYGSED